MNKFGWMRFILFFYIYIYFILLLAFCVLIIKWNNRRNTIIDVLSDAFRAMPLHVYYFSLSLFGIFFGRFTIKTWTSSLSYFFYYFTIFKQNISKKGEKQKFCSFFLCFMFITISYQLFSCLFFYCYHFIVMNIEIV